MGRVLAPSTALRRDYPALGVVLLSGRAAPGLTAVALPASGARAPAVAGAEADPGDPHDGSCCLGATERKPATAGASIWLLGEPYESRALEDAVERTVLRHGGTSRADASW